jgi:hypothetical protein
VRAIWPFVVLQDVGVGALEDAGKPPPLKRAAWSPRSGASAAGFDADEADFLVGDELVEGADGVGAAADTGDDRGGQAAFLVRESARASRPMTRWKSRTMVG